MASSSGKLCSQCEKKFKSTTAVSWCVDCNECLCLKCLDDHTGNKASRNHKTITVSQYIRIESVSSHIKLDCEEHHQRQTFYCLDHSVTVCALCVPEKHKQCSSLRPIDELARHSKTSTELLDIERGIKELENTIHVLQNNRQQNIDAIKAEKKIISGDIKSFRKQMNKYIDELESDLLKQLDSHCDQIIFQIDTLASQLKEKETEIRSLGEKLHQMKETFTDEQVFLATKTFGEKLREEIESVSTLCDEDAAKEAVIELSIDQQLNHLLSDLKRFGMIQVVQTKCLIKVGAWEQKRAQLHVPTNAVGDVDKTELERICDISFKGYLHIRDCAITDDGKIIFAVANCDTLLVYTGDGQLLKSIDVGQCPFGLAVINTNIVAVTCRLDSTIHIVHIDNGDVKQEIKVGKTCSGISYINDKLYVLVKDIGIMEFDLAGNLTKTIPVDVPSNSCYLSTYKDKICYTSYRMFGKNFIKCTDWNGREIWKLDVANSSVTVDNCGNYFAIDQEDDTLHIISADGKRTKEILLGEDDWINDPRCAFFDKKSSKLLVVCHYDIARLFRVV